LYCWKAKEDPYFKKDESVVTENVVSLDYGFMAKKPRRVRVRENEEQESDADEEDEAEDPSNAVLKVLVVRDRRTKYVTATVVPRKGDHPYAVHRVGIDITNVLGYKRCFVKTDQERAIRKLKSAVRLEYDVEIPDELAPTGDSQSNGEIEVTVQVVEGQVRTMKCHLEHRLQQEIPTEHPVLPWLVRHASATISRYQRGRDGMTAYRRLKGREFAKSVTEFGECVWYMRNKTSRRGKLESRWESGVFLGIREESNEILVGTPKGVLKARTFRRKGSDEDRWNKEEILAVKGFPWQPDPNVSTFDIRSRVSVRVEQPGEVELGNTREFTSRRLRITKRDLQHHGYSVGCAGCNAARRGTTAVNHSEECRTRITKALAEAGDPRVVRTVEAALGEAIDPSEMVPSLEPPEEPAGNVLLEDRDDHMSVVPETESVNQGVEEMLYELTADPYQAHKVAKWEKSVTDQWRGKHWDDGIHDMNGLVTERDIHAHVSEIYSPPRVTGLASGLGLIPGMALDLSAIDPDDGLPWDFNNPEKRRKALHKVFTQRSLLLIGSPMCSAFSQIQSLNWGRMDPREIERVKEYGRKHLRFACKLYALQLEMNLYFLHEHPAGASSWEEKCVTDLLDKPQVDKVVSDMCVFGMTQQDEQGTALVKKPTAFMTNSPAIARRLNHRCPGGHRHITLMGGRASRAEVYPEQLCREILLGLIDQMRDDGRLLGNGCLGSVTMFDEHQTEYKRELAQFWDDITGRELRADKVAIAREEEMVEFRKHNVYTKVPLAQCWAQTGKKPIEVCWVDINKGDEKNPKYRSRLVAKELDLDRRDDLFAATPPVEAKKLLLSLAATEGYGYDRSGTRAALKMDFIDVRRAFFHAPCRGEVYVELPPEDHEPGMCGILNMAMYGTRDAPQNWEFEYCEFMEKIGFTKGRSTPCLFYHEPRNLRVVVYGDDFTVLGPEDELDWFRKQMQQRYEVEFKARLGGQKQDDKDVFLLNRPIEWTASGITYEADQRHVEIIARDLQLGDKVKNTPFPHEKISAEEVRNPTAELSPEYATMYRAMTARANYLSQDRSDIRYAVKELSRSMSKPTEGDYGRLKRLGRYLKQHPRLIQHIRKQPNVKCLDVWVDIDFAGGLKTRKSTSGGVITIGDHVIKTWSTTQTTIALSPGEAEYYGMVKGASMAMGIRSMLQDLGVEMNVRLRTDASAAKGIASRRGLGKIRHIEVQQLWLQEKVNRGEIEVMKVKGEGNLSDALTKALDGPGTSKHILLTRQELVMGRHQLTPDFEAAEDTSKFLNPISFGGSKDDEWLHDVSQNPVGAAVLELLALDSADPRDTCVTTHSDTMPMKRAPPPQMVPVGERWVTSDTPESDERLRRYSRHPGGIVLSTKEDIPDNHPALIPEIPVSLIPGQVLTPEVGNEGDYDSEAESHISYQGCVMEIARAPQDPETTRDKLQALFDAIHVGLPEEVVTANQAVLEPGDESDYLKWFKSNFGNNGVCIGPLLDRYDPNWDQTASGTIEVPMTQNGVVQHVAKFEPAGGSPSSKGVTQS
jgi:hypothetical protein